MERYNHLSIEERDCLQDFLLEAAPRSQTAMAREMGRHKSTVSRELRRNRELGKHYKPHTAQLMADTRQNWKRAHPKRRDPNLLKIIKKLLRRDWSPEQIAGWLGSQFARQPGKLISHETIYLAIYDGHVVDNPAQCLRWKRKARKSGPKAVETRGHIPDRRMIDERPSSIGRRTRYGHWEADTMEGAGKDGYLLTIVERKMKILICVKLENKGAGAVADAIVRAMRKVPKKLRRSLTLDNGMEFAEHKRIERLSGMLVYFAHPRSPWERGTNENTNGLLRQYFPKGLRFSEVTQRMVDRAVRKLNTRVRKTLNWRTPQAIYRRVALAA
jgi:IS30 family transposase